MIVQYIQYKLDFRHPFFDTYFLSHQILTIRMYGVCMYFSSCNKSLFRLALAYLWLAAWVLLLQLFRNGKDKGSVELL